MKIQIRIIFCFAFLIYGSNGFSADQVLLEVPVTYHSNANVVQKVKNECQIEELLAQRVSPVLSKLNKSGTGSIPAESDPGDAIVLRLQISFVLGIGGGGWTGPKSITVNAELLEKGVTKRQTKITRSSMGGVFGGLKGTCSILDRSATAIAKDLGRWVKNPKYKIVEESLPKEELTSSSDDAESKTEEPK